METTDIINQACKTADAFIDALRITAQVTENLIDNFVRMRNILGVTYDLFLISEKSRVLHLAYYSKKRRTRKKNLKRLLLFRW